MKKNNSLSVLIITKNSTDLLPRCLASVQFADEVVIIDDHSTDQTVEVAKNFGAKVFTHTFVGFGQQKRFGLSKIKGHWILVLDADEILSKELQKEIQSTLAQKTNYNGYRLPYQNHFLGRPLKTLEQYAKIRLFRKKFGTVTNVSVHEETEVRPPIGQLRGKILHYSYRGIVQILTKFTQYADVESKQMVQKGAQATPRQLFLNPLHMFWSIFVEDKGYKDGIWGFGLALFFAYYEFARFVLLAKAKRKILPHEAF